jgi:hypothetical protein
MPAWKVLLIGLLGCICLALAMATIAIPIAQDGAQKWIWLGSLLTATIFTGGLLTLFLRHAGSSLDVSPRGNRS